MDTSDVARADELIRKLRAACHVQSLDVGRLASSLDLQLKARLSEAHHWDGASALDGQMPVLAFRLYPEAAFLASLPGESLSFFPHGWCLELGGMLTVSAVASPAVQFKYPPPRVFIYSTAEVLDHLAAGRFKAVFYRDTEPVAYYEVSFSDEHGGLSQFRGCIYDVKNHRGSLRDCREALFWQVVGALKSYGGFLRPEDRLSIGWQRDYERLLHCFSNVRDDVVKNCDFSGYKNADLPGELVEFFDTCLPSRFSANSVCPFAASAYGSMETFRMYVSNREKVKAFAGEGALEIGNAVIRLGLRDPSVTACGRKVPWIGGGHKGFGFLEPDPKSFPKWFNPEDYWCRLPQLPYWALGALVSPSDVPAELHLKPELWQRFPKVEKPGEAVGVADSLLEEAAANKHWVIPNRALVQLPLGIFTHFEVSEFTNEVFFVGRTERGEFAILEVEIDNKALSVPQLEEIAPESSSLRDEVYAALKLTLSAVIRDFWVVEERERVFAQKSAKRIPGVRIHQDEDGAARIVYLPRVRYKEKPTPENCARALEHQARAAHFVQAHLRRVGRASDAQIILARRYGFAVPEGHTFVRPHERGKESRPVIYRSRSALQTLYRIDETLPPGKAEWFRFEKDMETLMKRLGFEVQHRAAARRGDKGVDLYATKGADLDCVNWVIQCKCYHPNHKIGPDKVRELHGVVSTYPAGTRGMIVTTSSFAAGAVALAAELNIRLMDGNEFAQRIR